MKNPNIMDQFKTENLSVQNPNSLNKT